MRIGFGRVDITPRVGVGLAGFGAFLNRRSIGVRDRLWARAMAVEHGGTRAVIVSCDLLGITAEDTRRARLLVTDARGLPPEAMMVAATHTHSGPATLPTTIGWGDPDPPYMELLPGRIARAAVEALDNLAEARLLHAEVPCEGIGLNREQDRDAPPLEEVLRIGWRPARPELTDTTCHVLAARAETQGRLIGFVSCFGCHPVCCCAATRYIHGDFVGVATNLLESEHPGSVGLFLQGANGDVNSCVVHKPERESLEALDVIAGRYAEAVRRGLQQAQPIDVDAVRFAMQEVRFTRRALTAEDFRRQLREEESHLADPDATDSDQDFRMSVIRAIAFRRLLASLEGGQPLDLPVELQGIRIGPLALLGTPFEVFQEIARAVRAGARSAAPLVLSDANGHLGYAADRAAVERGGYAADVVPVFHGIVPFARLYEELPQALLDLDRSLH